MTDKAAGVSLVVPDFFSDGETHEALAIVTEAIGVEVHDRGVRRTLASAELQQPVQFALEFLGAVGLDLLKDLTADAIRRACVHLAERFRGRHVSVEIYAKNEAGHGEDYYLEGLTAEALRAIPADLEREKRGTRVEYDADEGWLTWEESSEKRRRAKRASEEPPASA